MKLLTLPHSTGIYMLSPDNVQTLFTLAMNARITGTKLDEFLVNAGIESKLIECLKEQKLWLYGNLEAIAKGDSSRPFVKVPSEWASMVNEAWSDVKPAGAEFQCTECAYTFHSPAGYYDVRKRCPKCHAHALRSYPPIPDHQSIYRCDKCEMTFLVEDCDHPYVRCQLCGEYVPRLTLK